MILVSLSSAEDASSHDVKKYIILLARKVLKIPRSAFWGDTRYMTNDVFWMWNV